VLSLLAVVNPHRGVVLPVARIIVIMVPVAVMCFYVFVVRARKNK
jgi:hypothetical protein